MDNSIKIIVARYNENIEWTKQFKNVLIYNKGELLDSEYRQIILPNVGREGHTYYQYIYDNYYNLDDYTIFLQGNPYDHSLKIDELINSSYDIVKHKNINFAYLSEKIYYTNFNGCPHLPTIGLHLHTKHVFYKLFGKIIEEQQILFGGGAQFIVSRERIHSRPRELYLKIIKILEYHVNPVEGHVIERLHRFIFTNKFIHMEQIDEPAEQIDEPAEQIDEPAEYNITYEINEKLN
jgi:hypothetical protein